MDYTKEQGNEKKTDPLHNDPGGIVDGDHQTYLRVAEIVLANALSPLKAREIVDRGIERGLFGDHVLSRMGSLKTSIEEQVRQETNFDGKFERSVVAGSMNVCT